MLSFARQSSLVGVDRLFQLGMDVGTMRDVYCQDSITIISQEYHNERALYQAKHLGIDAIAFNAKMPAQRTSWWRNRGREVLALSSHPFIAMFNMTPLFNSIEQY